MNIILYIVGGLFALGLLYAILYICCRMFWLRTIITMAATVAAMIVSFSEEQLAYGICYFIAYFFLFGKSFAQKTGEVEYDRKLDLEKGTYKETERSLTHTIGNIGSSVVLALISVYLVDLHVAVKIALPSLILIIKYLRIKQHIRNGESEFDAYDDDDDPSTTTYTTHF